MKISNGCRDHLVAELINLDENKPYLDEPEIKAIYHIVSLLIIAQYPAFALLSDNTRIGLIRKILSYQVKTEVVHLSVEELEMYSTCDIIISWLDAGQGIKESEERGMGLAKKVVPFRKTPLT